MKSCSLARCMKGYGTNMTDKADSLPKYKDSEHKGLAPASRAWQREHSGTVLMAVPWHVSCLFCQPGHAPNSKDLHFLRREAGLYPEPSWYLRFEGCYLRRRLRS